MTIHLPTGELVGMLADVVPFAESDPDYPDSCCVRIAWDGDELHAQAHNRYHFGWAHWGPHYSLDQDYQEDMLASWGGDDPAWEVTISLADAKHLVKTYKLGGKRRFITLGIQVTDGGGELRITRERSGGCSAISTVVETTDAIFADLGAIMDKHRTIHATDALLLDASYLAHFAKVRALGPLSLEFTGPHGPVLATIGERFTGAIQPVRPRADDQPADRLIDYGPEPAGGEQP